MAYRPHWAKEKAPEHINATVEKVATFNYFKGAFAHHRCLGPADGWYEWLPADGKKQPHCLCREDREPVWLAGIWGERPDGKLGCAILSEPARGVAADIHLRIPLALDAESLEPYPPDRSRDDPPLGAPSARRVDHPLAREYARQSAAQRRRELDESVNGFRH